MSELVLGTAQFGAGYGVTNMQGRLDDSQVVAIIRDALAKGIARVDTAAGYSDAQARLRPWSGELTITTKVAGKDATTVRSRLEASLGDLGVGGVDSCLLHDWSTLDPAERANAAAALETCRDAGLVRSVGISAYEEADLASALDAFAQLDIVQVPANALDRRLDASPSIDALAAVGARVQVRSAFLQGLLATPSSTALGAHRSVLAFHRACAVEGRSPLAVALGHVKALPWATEIVVGVTSPAELDEIAAAWLEPPALASQGLASDDLGLLDPRNW